MNAKRARQIVKDILRERAAISGWCAASDGRSGWTIHWMSVVERDSAAARAAIHRADDYAAALAVIFP